MSAAILGLRVALTTADYEGLLAFYRDGLGIDPAQFWSSGEDQGHGVMFELGRASLEIFDEPYASSIDTLEAGRRVSGQVRLALQVADLKATMEQVLAHGGTLVHDPVVTPWGDQNVRISSPDGLQITLYQVLDRDNQSTDMN